VCWAHALAYSGPHAAEYAGAEDPASADQARAIWDEIDGDVRSWIGAYRNELTGTVVSELKTAGKDAKDHEKVAFELRINEVASLQRNQSIEKLKREIEEHRTTALQYSLLEDVNERADRELRDLQDELKRRQGQFGDLLERLKLEKQRILEQVLPQRFSHRGGVQVFPVTIEIRLPEVSA
jgi:hypothetical protein